MVMLPELLSDKLKLDEIYKLRVKAWQSSHNAQYVNSTLLPDGWADDLDQKAYHWVIFNNDSQVVASARLNVLKRIEEVPNNEAFKKYFSVFSGPIAFYSRLVVHPEFRGNNYSTLLDLVRIEFIKSNSIGLTLATSDGKRTEKLRKYGFTVLGQSLISFGLHSSKPFNADILALILE